jgi:hypothetical protein
MPGGRLRESVQMKFRPSRKKIQNSEAVCRS